MTAILFRLSVVLAFLVALVPLSFGIEAHYNALQEAKKLENEIAGRPMPNGCKGLKPWELAAKNECAYLLHSNPFDDLESNAIVEKRTHATQLILWALVAGAGVMGIYYILRWIITGKIRPLVPQANKFKENAR